MMTLQPMAAFAAAPPPCPGPQVKSAAHAERCRACGKCGALARLFDATREAASDDAVRVEFSGVVRSN